MIHIKYASSEGLTDYPYMKYRFLYVKSFLNKWYNDKNLKRVLLNPGYEIRSSKFPINFAIEKNLIELRLSELILSKIRYRENVNEIIHIVTTNYSNSPLLRNVINQHAKACMLLKKELAFTIIKVKDSESLLDVLKRVSGGKMVLIDLWAQLVCSMQGRIYK